MPTPPKSVTIGGVKIRIRVDPTLDDWGQWHGDAREILLAKKSTESRETLSKTLWHEMTHATLDITGMSHLTKYEEEPITRALELMHTAWEEVRDKLGE